MGRGRSASGAHGLLPANNKHAAISLPHIPMHIHSTSTLGKGTVIWRIWPAVLLHTVFAAIIVVVSRKTDVHLGIPNVLLTLLGVVIGFVISLRVSSGYDRYWWGRCAWSDIIKQSRTMSRLVWIHLPVRITTPNGNPNAPIPREEIGQAMREKRIALELIEAFAVAMKHHVRGELGIYYEDLYHIVRPFHDHHSHPATETPVPKQHLLNARAPKRQHSIESYSQLPSAQLRKSPSFSSSSIPRQDSFPGTSRQNSIHLQAGDPIVPPIESYGARASLRKASSRTSLGSSNSSDLGGERDPLLPSSIPGPATGASFDLVPGTSIIVKAGRALNPYNWWRSWRANWEEGFEGNDEAGGVGIRWGEPQHDHPQGYSTSTEPTEVGGHNQIQHRRAARQTHKHAGKHRPRIAGDGENLPLEILRCMSDWLAMLEARGTAGGNTLGGLFACVAAYEDILSTLERILTTPLPYVYSVHIRHTVWLYLFFLPFQLADDFSWYTIPGTAVAAFFYLGFIAAGDEIEQPFGYDENDLDLDLFCKEVIKADLHTLTVTPFPNAPMGSHHVDYEINEASTVVDVSLGKHRD